MLPLHTWLEAPSFRGPLAALVLIPFPTTCHGSLTHWNSAVQVLSEEHITGYIQGGGSPPSLSLSVPPSLLPIIPLPVSPLPSPLLPSLPPSCSLSRHPSCLLLVSEIDRILEITNSFNGNTLLKSLFPEGFISRTSSAFLPQPSECITHLASVPMATEAHDLGTKYETKGSREVPVFPAPLRYTTSLYYRRKWKLAQFHPALPSLLSGGR